MAPSTDSVAKRLPVLMGTRAMRELTGMANAHTNEQLGRVLEL